MATPGGNCHLSLASTMATWRNSVAGKSKSFPSMTPVLRSQSFSHFTKKVTLFPKPKSHFHVRTIPSLFTGIVEEIGEVKRIGSTVGGGVDIEVKAKIVSEDVNLGDSISVNGACLTVTSHADHVLTMGLSAETLRRTSFMDLKPGSPVNLERAIQPTGRMGGHFVQGHVDGTGEIVEKTVEVDSLWVKVRMDKALLPYVVPKGFIAVDGTSLTVADVLDEESCFSFMMVPYTLKKVAIASKNIREKVNLEVDILGKLVWRILRGRSAADLNARNPWQVHDA